MTHDPLDQGVIVAEHLDIRRVRIADLREQDVNARVMGPREFDRLIENIRGRGALESLPLCHQPQGTGPITIVSGHHRVRAARAAGLTHIITLVDTSLMTRSQVVAKQLAHNFLNGSDDQDVLKILLGELATPDDMLASAAPEELFAELAGQTISLFAPNVDFEQRTVTFGFLPHQVDELERLIDRLNEQAQELVVVGNHDQFEALLKAGSRYARIRKVLSGSTAIALMIRLALDEVEANENGVVGNGVVENAS